MWSCWKVVLLATLALSFVVQTKCEQDADDDVDIEVEEPESAPEEPVEKPQYREPQAKGNAYFAEPFQSKSHFAKRWVLSQAKKDGTDEEISKYDGKWDVQEPKDNAMDGDLALVLKSKAKHHAVAANLDKPFDFPGKPLIVQYEVRFQNGLDCGGAYIKLLSRAGKVDLKDFHDKTPYTIMFGPDKCGLDHKLHFIFRHKNPKTGSIEEKHAKKPTANIDKYFTDKKTHLFTLVVNPDNSFEVLIDNTVVNEGTLLNDVSPPVNPPKEIDDPNDKKPADWDDKEKIPDPDAEKPDDWDESEPEKIADGDAEMPSDWLEDESELLPDPDAEKPADWDDDMDGEWEAPMISNPKCKDASGCGEWKRPMTKNPKYKGKWKRPVIENPNYKGVWKPRIIPNPDFFEDNEPYKMTPIGAVGLELWSMSDDIAFDNFLVTDSRSVSEAWAADTWEIKSRQENAASGGRSVVQAILDITKDRPWLWAVFLVVVVLPIVLIIAYCCMSKSEPEDIDAYRKKTDETSPDDQEPGEEVPEQMADDLEDAETLEQNAADVAAGGDNPVTVKKTKASLEAEEENENEEDEDEEGQEADAEDEARSSESPKKSPRRRRARKE